VCRNLADFVSRILNAKVAFTDFFFSTQRQVQTFRELALNEQMYNEETPFSVKSQIQNSTKFDQ
jgi:hypothetical protein